MERLQREVVSGCCWLQCRWAGQRWATTAKAQKSVTVWGNKSTPQPFWEEGNKTPVQELGVTVIVYLNTYMLELLLVGLVGNITGRWFLWMWILLHRFPEALQCFLPAQFTCSCRKTAHRNTSTYTLPLQQQGQGLGPGLRHTQHVLGWQGTIPQLLCSNHPPPCSHHKVTQISPGSCRRQRWPGSWHQSSCISFAYASHPRGEELSHVLLNLCI